ncbi:MAG: hypothetical protein JWL77_2118 [Chthonomonadaceae bacterium]|nr:hypothetical protein [Chthonomonadaceae bacterium]
MRKAVILMGAWLLVLGLAAPAQARTQRRINSAAAGLFRVHLALVEEPGTRRPEESLPLYFGRLLALQPGEKPAVRHARVAAYLALLDQAAERTAGLRKIPTLQTTSASNRALWQQISLNLQAIPAEAAKARLAWAREEAGPATPSETARTFTQTLWHIQNAYAALRDALP